MTDKQIIIDGCEFQSYCIEYKDISYLKIMPICAIHELSIACHDKVNKCKYYKLYKQLKAKEQECEDLKEKHRLEMKAKEKKNKLKNKKNSIYKDAPITTNKAVKLAKQALNVAKDNEFSDEEINSFLPPSLHKEKFSK